MTPETPQLDGTAAPETPYRSPYAKVPVWSQLYGTKCVFYEGPETSCPTPHNVLWPSHGEQGLRGATVCCPGSPEESVSPPEPKEPPWPPPACLDTGITECDAYVKAQFESWKLGARVEERLFLRCDLDSGCTNYRQQIRREGVDTVRGECVMGLGLLRSVPVASVIGPARAPAPMTRDQALGTISSALQHQVTPPPVCPQTVDECDKYIRAFYKCWKRATPQTRSFLKPIPDECGVYDRRIQGDEWLHITCQDDLDSVLEHPACKP
jgi:hypothetical protein